MTSHANWKKLTENKIDVVRKMIKANENVIAAEYMGYTLECALKAACCKTLHISCYPPTKPTNNSELGHFRTHEFDSLLIFSGLSDILGSKSMSWSTFTSYYTGDWPQIIRYNTESAEKTFTSETVGQLYDLLYDREDSILKIIFGNKRW